MRALTAVLGIVLLLIPCLAMAQFGWYEEGKAQDTWGVKAGWADLGDLGSGFQAGVDYKINAFGQKWLAGLEWASGENDASVWDLNFNWIQDVQADAYKWYYGAGVGWYYGDCNGENKSSFGAQLLVGMDFAQSWYAEARYVLATSDLDAVTAGDQKADGLRLAVGYRF